MRPHEKVSELVSYYGREKQRIKLELLGIGHLNRAISYKYVHSKLRRILDAEGFSSFRYKHAIGVEPSDG